MADIMVENKQPASHNFMRRLKDMQDGTFAEQVYVANMNSVDTPQHVVVDNPVTHVTVDNLPAVQHVAVDNFPTTQNVVVQRVGSSTITVTSFNNASHAALITAVNAYLATSTKKLVSFQFFAGGLVTLLFYCVVAETV